jgi:hypothetical protein
MDEEVSGARVPFDMRLHVPPMAQASFIADNYHAMKRLVAEGYITIKPDTKLRLGPRGLWEADGQPPLTETTARERSPVEPYISAETVNSRTSPGPNYLSDAWDVWRRCYSPGYDSQCSDSENSFDCEENMARLLPLIDGAKEILDATYSTAHPTWVKLHKLLHSFSPDEFTEKGLRSIIIDANVEEAISWGDFSASHAYCIGSRPRHSPVPVNALITALCYFSGCFLGGSSTSEAVHLEDEGNQAIERRRVDALRQAAETTNPSNVASMIRYIEMVQTARDNEHHYQQSDFAVMEDLYHHLEAMVKERMLGRRMMQLIGL